MKFNSVLLSILGIVLLLHTQAHADESIDALGHHLPADAMLTNSSGQHQRLGDLLDSQDTVLLLTLNYFRCKTMCVFQLQEMAQALHDMAPSGKGWHVRAASISFDPQDTPQSAAHLQQLWAANLKKTPFDNRWGFYVTDAATAKRLAQALNFYYNQDPQTKEYSHTAGLFFLDKNLELKRFLYGIIYNPQDIKWAILDTETEKKGHLWSRLKRHLWCYNFKIGRYEFCPFSREKQPTPKDQHFFR